MKKVVLVLVYGIPSAVPKGWLISFKDVQKQINKVVASSNHEVHFCFIDSFMLDESICFLSSREDDSTKKDDSNLLLRNIDVQKIILKKVAELGKKSVEVKFLAGTSVVNVEYSEKEILEKSQ